MRTEIATSTTGSEARSFKSSLVTFSVAALSLFFSAPAVISAVFHWVPKSITDRVPSDSRLWNFVGFSEIAVLMGGRVYLFLALVLNVTLLFRRQAAIWPKVLAWALFIVAVLGLLGVEAEVRHSFLR
jgi:hypothetical protein